MSGNVEVAREGNIIAVSVVSEVLLELVSQAMFRLTNIRRTEKAVSAVYDVARCACKGVGDMIETMMSACVDGSVRGAVATTAAWTGERERSRLGDRVREEIVNQEVTQVVSSFEGEMG